MKITSLPSKPESRFTRPSYIKNDSHHILSTPKYEVEIVFHSSMFYAPEFYCVTVKDKAGNEIWSGGELIFLDSLFSNDFISDKHDRMVLVRVNSTDSPNQMQVLLVDLKTGKEEVLTAEDHYASAGHFCSFDGIYYSFKNGIQCIDFSDNSRFLLNEVLDKHFVKVKTWGVCPIRDCILVITEEEVDNVILFNLRERAVLDKITWHWGIGDYVSLGFWKYAQPSATTIFVHYSDRQTSGALKHRATEYFKIEF